MSRTDEVYRPALNSRKIPVLTLDNKWHQLFTQTDPNPEIIRLEKELNELLMRQGKITTETKELKRLKTRLMDEIVSLMGEESKAMDAKASKKQEENKRLINECNDKLTQYQDEMLDIPRQIEKVNHALMLATMEVCYEMLSENTRCITEISEWINQIRIELKKNVVRKQERELQNQEMYTYMHDIFGPEVIEIFDMKYDPGQVLLKKSEKSEGNAVSADSSTNERNRTKGNP